MHRLNQMNLKPGLWLDLFMSCSEIIDLRLFYSRHGTCGAVFHKLLK